MQESTTLCYCTGIKYGDVKRAYEEGNETVDAIKERTGAGTVCRRCVKAIEEYIQELKN